MGCVVWQGLSHGKGSSKLSGQLCLIKQFIYLFSNVSKAKIRHFSTIKEMVCFTRIFFFIRQTKIFSKKNLSSVLMLWLNNNHLAKKTNLLIFLIRFIVGCIIIGFDWMIGRRTLVPFWTRLQRGAAQLSILQSFIVFQATSMYYHVLSACYDRV